MSNSVGISTDTNYEMVLQEKTRDRIFFFHFLISRVTSC